MLTSSLKSDMSRVFVFFLRVFMGDLDTGIIYSARGVIASNLNISQSTSIWMVTIYTLVEAVSMSITNLLLIE